MTIPAARPLSTACNAILVPHPPLAIRCLAIHILLVFWTISLGVLPAVGADDILVEAVRRGPAVEVNARATLNCSHKVIWDTLTDYDRLAQFIPGLRVSRIVAWHGNEAIIDQVGEAKFLFFKFPIEVTVGSTSRPPDAINIRVLKGNLKRLDGGYRIETVKEGRYILRWQGLIEPDAMLPPLIGTAVMRSNIEDQFTGMVREIERRDAEIRFNESKTGQ